MEQDDVVISGVGGHYPECNNLQEYKDALMNGTDVITDNAERWKPGRLGMVTKTGKIYGIDKFDAVFFGMHRKLTDATDPMSRVIMERVFEAIVDAGLNPVDLRGTRTAVYIGSALSESENIFIQTTAEDGFGIMGHNRSMMANRVSYYFDFKGPSYALDTSFCSGLSALELGKRAILCGEVDLAIVGTATLSFHPEITQHFHDLGCICPDGVTKPFGKDANGWVRSEAAICMLLQRRSTAKRVYASVVHAKVKKFGEDHKAPLMDIDRRHFARHLQEFYQELEQDTGITPQDIDYLEAQGVGQKTLDEVEVAAVDAAICARRSSPLLMGSVTGQMGHGEASSGLISLSKVLVAMECGVVPATLHVSQDAVNPKLRAIVEGRLQLVTEHTPLPGQLVALNNFGVCNLFGHAVFRINGKDKKPIVAPEEEVMALSQGALTLQPLPKMVFVSARNEERLQEALDKLHALQEDDPEYSALMHGVYTSNIYGHLQRAFTFLPKTEALSHKVAPHGGARRPVWFIYSGMGSQWPGMARHLLRVPVFRAALQRCHDVLVPHGVDLLHIVTTEDPTIYDNILHSFVGIAAVQVGLTDVLASLGIKPDGIIGHSVGELGCGYADGCFTAEQMVLAAHARGRASIETELIRGTMAAVGLGYSQIKPLLPEPIEVACRNSATSCTISGPAEDMQRFVGQLKDKGYFAKAVNVSNIAYHSRYIAPAGPKLLALLKDVLPDPRPRSEKWVSTSVLEERWGDPLAQTSSAEYHTNNLLSPVFFEEGSRKIPKDAICIEIAPHGLLQAIIRRSLDQGVTNVPLTRRDAPDGAVFLLEAIGNLYLSGLNPQIQNLYAPVEYPVSRGTGPLSPLVDWDHTETWYTGRYSQQTDFVAGEKHNPVRSLDPKYAPYRDCVWKGRSIITPAVCLEEVVAMIYRINDDQVPIVFEDVQFHRIADMPMAEEALLYVLYQRGSGYFEVSTDMKVLARGRAFSPFDGAKGLKKLWASQPPLQDESRVVASQDEVYDELERRGVHVDGKLRGLRQVVQSASDVQGRVTNHDDRMLLLDTLLQLYTVMESEARSELCVPHRVQRIILDPNRALLCEAGPEPEQAVAAEGEQAEKEVVQVLGPLLPELVFRLHRASGVLRCANVELRGVTTRPLHADSAYKSLALDLEHFLVHGDKASPLETVDEMACAAVQLASQQMALHPLSRRDTEAVVGVLEGGRVLEEVLHDVARRTGHLVVRRVSPLEAAECDLLVGSVADDALPLLAPHALLLRCSDAQDAVQHDGLHEVLLQHASGSQRLVLLKKVQPVPHLPAHVVEVQRSSQLSHLRVPPAGITYLVWRCLPEQGITALLKDTLRPLPGAHRVRSVFLLDSTAPRFSPTHPFYAQQMRLGLAVNVLQSGAWGNLYLSPRPLAEPEHPAMALRVNRLSNIPNLNVEFLGLNGAVMEPTNLKVRNGYILDIEWPPKEKQPRGAGLLDYAGTREGAHVMGVVQAETMSVDPILQWAVPQGWSLEDAATVPYAYAMAYLALVHTAKILPSESALIHDAWSAVGQAAIDVALDLGCKVYTTIRTEEERGLVQQRFPKLPADQILSLQGEEFEKVLASTLTGDRQRRGVRFLLSNLSGEGLWASLRSVGMYGRIVQINSSDPSDGVRMGMNIFLKSTSFYGLDPTCLVHLADDVRLAVQGLVQAGLDSGVVRPIDRTVLPASHAQRAVSYLDGDVTDKVVLQMGPSKAPLRSADGQRFECDQRASYLVVGGCRSQALHTVEWLLSRGARCVLLGGLPESALSQVTLRRLALMRARWGAHVTTVPGVRADTPQGAATLISRAANMAPLQAVFILPSAIWQEDEAVQALGGVLRGPDRESVLLVAVVCEAEAVESRTAPSSVGISVPRSRVAEACAARRRAGGRAVLVSLAVAAPHLRMLALDSALVDPQPVLHVGLLPEDQHEATLKERLGELLPLSQDSLVSLGRSALRTSRSSTRSTLLPSLFGGVHAKSYEVPPVFLVPGLAHAPTDEMQPLARLLQANTVLLESAGGPGLSDADVTVTELADELVDEVVSKQPQGPYTVVARGWAGCVGLEMARLLEQRGQRVALMLLDCAPRDLQAAVWGLGQEGALGAWLLCSLLHLSPTAYDVLESLPSWSERASHALDLVDDLTAERRAELAAGLDLVFGRLRALARYNMDFTLQQTVVTLLRPAGAEGDDARGLDKVSEMPVQVEVAKSALGTADFWHEAARVVSRGVYVGSKPMHLQVSGKSFASDTLWQRLR